MLYKLSVKEDLYTPIGFDMALKRDQWDLNLASKWAQLIYG
jgi:hypothetical protein